MAFKTLYTVYDKGKPLGEHTTKEWEDLLSIPRQAIRDYAREGRTYGKRYAFEMVGTVASDGEETEPENPGITMRDLAEFKRSVKVGDKFTYKSYRRDFVWGVRIETEKMIVVRKFPHLVQVESVKDPKRIATMSYVELFKQKKRRKKKKTARG